MYLNLAPKEAHRFTIGSNSCPPMIQSDPAIGRLSTYSIPFSRIIAIMGSSATTVIAGAVFFDVSMPSNNEGRFHHVRLLLFKCVCGVFRQFVNQKVLRTDPLAIAVRRRLFAASPAQTRTVSHRQYQYKQFQSKAQAAVRMLRFANKKTDRFVYRCVSMNLSVSKSGSGQPPSRFYPLFPFCFLCRGNACRCTACRSRRAERDPQPR